MTEDVLALVLGEGNIPLVVAAVALALVSGHDGSGCLSADVGDIKKTIVEELCNGKE